MKNISLPQKILNNEQDAIFALKTVFNILDKWACTTEEKIRLLGLERSTYFKYLKTPESAKININLLERLSYILNIHSALRILFNDPESVYTWIRKPNKAPLFHNQSALDKMLSGYISDLSDVSRYLNAQRGGWS